MIIKTIIFDFDGTLANTINLNHKVMNELADYFHFRKITHSEVLALKGLPASKVLSFFNIPWFKIPFVMAEGKKRLNQYIDQVVIDDRLKSLLEKIKKQCQLGIVTTNSEENVRLFLEANNVVDFDFIYSNARLSGKKRALKNALRKQNILTQNILYVGDEIRDIHAAKMCDCKVAAVCWGYNSKEAIVANDPDFLVNTPEELELIIERFINLSG